MAKKPKRGEQNSAYQRITIPSVEISIEPEPEKIMVGTPEPQWKQWAALGTQEIEASKNHLGTITKIKKRNGVVVDFDKGKIRIAMEKAARAINPTIDLRQFDVIADHATRHIEIKFKDRIPDVESVQDLVEQTLMEYGLFDIAKAYIIYRAERTKVRKSQEKLPIAVEQPKVFYLDNHGGRKELTKEKLTQLFSDVSRDYEKDVNISMLVEHCQANIYDGMSQDELARALVLTTRAFIEKDPVYSKIATRLALNNLYEEIFKISEVTNIDTAYREAFINTIKDAVKNKRLTPDLLEYDLAKLASFLNPARDSLLEYLGFQTLYDRYFLRQEGGEKKLETPQAFWMRVAMGLATNEGNQKEQWVKKFYDIISTLRYVPSTPTLFHAGTTYPQLSSCYLNTVADDLNHIFKVFSDNAQLSKYSGGIGTDWSSLRGTGAVIKSTNVGSQGVIPFLKIANDVTVAINRSGKRRGATAAYMETWHYDIEDFIDLRKNTGDERRRTHDMNTVNWIPDLFVKRITENGQWTLFSPDETPELHHIYGREFEKKYIEYEKKADNGQIKLWKRMPAKELWRKMITLLFETGHPWVTFKDPSNIRSPQDHVGVVHNSNLCTEITLNTSVEETAVCNLGSINLSKHIVHGQLETQLLKETVQIAMRMLDNVIDVNFYPTPEAKTANSKHRPVGLGIMGFQDALYMMGVEFESEKAVEFADESMEFISYYAILTSSQLAKERGAYQTYAGSKWDRGIFPIDTLDLLEQERGMPIPVSRISRLDWTPVRSHVRQYGMRNSNTMAIAPTATISNISGCFPCIEPIYNNLYVKSNMSGEFTVVNKYLVEDLKRLDLWNETMLDELKRNDGNVTEITFVPPRLRSLYKSVFDISPEMMVKIAAYRGKWIDQSQSLNIFFKGTSGKRLADVYMLAWHLGLKTTYYLRTLGATKIEKSTLNVHSQNIHTNSSADPLPAPEPVLKTQPLPEAIIEPEPEPVIKAEINSNQNDLETQIGKACLIDDPDCEACQ